MAIEKKVTSRWEKGHKGLWYLLDDKGYNIATRFIDDSPYLEDVNFKQGKEIEIPITEPLSYSLEEIDEDDPDMGPFMPASFLEAIPLFGKDFIKLLENYGVKNMQCFEAAIFDPESNETINDYMAVNVMGTFDIADQKKTGLCPKGHIHYDLEKLSKIPENYHIIRDIHGVLLRNELVDYLLNNGLDEHAWFSHFRDGLFYSINEMLRDKLSKVPECCI